MKIKEPNEKEVRELINKIHCEGVPHWTSSDLHKAHEELRSLYYHWFRKAI